ncbi:MAG TPA: nucleotide disphospho-sugar-binding domain-containing protein [Kribbellaceae bacterium]|nr:nucleotide disphospho-sugar-binding domain-containing protein [Kribbellaceae bacterium]
MVVLVPAADEALRLRMPTYARVMDDVPLALVAPTCRLVVHQGDTGSMMTSMACGVVQLAVAAGGQEDRAMTVLAETGAGRALPARTAGPQAFQDG